MSRCWFKKRKRRETENLRYKTVWNKGATQECAAGGFYWCVCLPASCGFVRRCDSVRDFCRRTYTTLQQLGQHRFFGGCVPLRPAPRGRCETPWCGVTKMCVSVKPTLSTKKKKKAKKKWLQLFVSSAGVSLDWKDQPGGTEYHLPDDTLSLAAPWLRAHTYKTHTLKWKACTIAMHGQGHRDITAIQLFTRVQPLKLQCSTHTRTCTLKGNPHM